MGIISRYGGDLLTLKVFICPCDSFGDSSFINKKNKGLRIVNPHYSIVIIFKLCGFLTMFDLKATNFLMPFCEATSTIL